MAGLPPDGRILVQQIGGTVVVYDRHTEEEFYRFDPSDQTAIGPVLQQVWIDDRFTPEQKCFTAFWSGYMYAHAH